MKKLYLLMLIFGSIFTMSPGYSTGSETNQCYSQNESLDELYPLSYEDLEICREGIFLNHHGQSIQLRGIIQDSSGNLFGSTNEWSFTWRCPKCKYENGTFSKTCAKCGYRPSAGN